MSFEFGEVDTERGSMVRLLLGLLTVSAMACGAESEQPVERMEIGTARQAILLPDQYGAEAGADPIQSQTIQKSITV